MQRKCIILLKKNLTAAALVGHKKSREQSPDL